MDYNNTVQLEIISKAILGAASASGGKRLELSDYVLSFLHSHVIVLNSPFNSYVFLSSFLILFARFLSQLSFLFDGPNIGSHLLLV